MYVAWPMCICLGSLSSLLLYAVREICSDHGIIACRACAKKGHLRRTHGARYHGNIYAVILQRWGTLDPGAH